MTLRASGVSYAYGRALTLDDVSLELQEGQLLGLVGPNGAGKSTLLRCLYGSLRARAGSVTLDGRELDALTRREIARAIGVVPQRCHPAFPVSVRHFVGMGRYSREALLGGPKRADAAAVQERLRELDLEALAERSVDELSGGEFRRVLIAQALAQDPRILLFDEPVQQLDLLHQLEVMEFARAFARRGGTASLIVLHDLGLAARYCDRIALLHAGRLQRIGSPEEIFTTSTLREVWGVEAAIESSPATGSLHVVPIAAARPRSRAAAAPDPDSTRDGSSRATDARALPSSGA